ncbi:MAG: efflux RND transporter periplasmic adaptor subunit [Saprospiraceae bacterium]|nr:efflux RND transporter periplasmic adaptor subunit [Saprospiraceae bacterium]
MKNLVFILFSILLVSSCQPLDPEAEKQALLAEKKSELTAKKTELQTLQEEINTLTEEILVLEPKREKAPILITTETLDKQEFKRFTQVQASVLSDDEVFVSSETGGRILSVKVKEGQYVKRGQLLVTVDLKALVDQKAELETSMSLAKDVYDRQKRLWDQQIGTEIQFLQAKNNYERLEKSLSTLNTQIGKANIYSPISGVVDREFLKAGEVAAPGAPIVQLFNPNKLKIAADVPESYLGKIKRGDQVEINFPAINKQITKAIALLGRTIDPSNRTFKVEVTTSSEGGALKPNLLAELMFNDFTKQDAIVVPLEIVQEEVSGRKYVFTVGEKEGKSIAQKSYVTTGEGYLGDIIIETGLNAGDQIIIDGARSVANGDVIKNMTK